SENRVRQENIETASTVTSIIPAITVNSDHNSIVIIPQNNQPEPISSELISLCISNTLHKANNLANSRFFDVKIQFLRLLIINMPSTRSGPSYDPSSSSQKGHRLDYGRSQLVTEGQGLHLTDSKENELSALLYDRREAFASEKEPLGAIIGYEVDNILNIERPYPPLLRRPAFPASLKSREALEIHIKELLDLGVIRKVGHNEEVEITKPVIVECNNEKTYNGWGL
ncbi:hypothetical protein O181_101583, partial [Austropuccinia psidii MF-1]|nr:hypothetical protein [Austropuccinia psidii MF-1]